MSRKTGQNMRKTHRQLITGAMTQPVYANRSESMANLRTYGQLAANQSLQSGHTFTATPSTSASLPKNIFGRNSTLKGLNNNNKRKSNKAEKTYHVNAAAKLPKFTGNFKTTHSAGNTGQSCNPTDSKTPGDVGEPIVLRPVGSALLNSLARSAQLAKKPLMMKPAANGTRPALQKENDFNNPPIMTKRLPEKVIADSRTKMTTPPPVPQGLFNQTGSRLDEENVEEEEEEGVDTDVGSDDISVQEEDDDLDGNDALQQALNANVLYAEQPHDETMDIEPVMYTVDPRLVQQYNVSQEIIPNETESGGQGNNNNDAQMDNFNEEQVINGNDNNENLPRHNVPPNLNRRNIIAYLEEENHDPEKCCTGCKDISIHILKSLIQLQETAQNNPNMAIIPQPTFDLLPRLPFDNIEDLDVFDEKLGDPREANMADQFEQLLSTKGGNTLSKIVSKAMSVFITDELCKKITWTGVKDTLKAEIMNFPAIVKRVVRKQLACKDSEAEEQIKDWLRRPSDRIAQREKTERNKILRKERRQARLFGNAQNQN